LEEQKRNKSHQRIKKKRTINLVPCLKKKEKNKQTKTIGWTGPTKKRTKIQHQAQ
jgi:hypothetical protein